MYRLYHSPYSQHSRRVVSLLESESIPYEAQVIDLGADEHNSDAYLAINPNHQVPTLIDGDVRIHESNAILRYLCTKHGLTGWYPQDPATRADVEQWLDWNQSRLSSPVVDIVLNTVFMGEHGDKAAIRRGTQTLRELAPILGNRLADREYLAGSKPTIADLSVASNLFQLGFADAIPVDSRISNWFARINGLPGFQASLPQM